MRREWSRTQVGATSEASDEVELSKHRLSQGHRIDGARARDSADGAVIGAAQEEGALLEGKRFSANPPSPCHRICVTVAPTDASQNYLSLLSVSVLPARPTPASAHLLALQARLNRSLRQVLLLAA